MRTRQLGRTGIEVSELTMGCWEIGGQYYGPIDAFVARRLLHRALDAGITTFDTAESYGGGRSECIIGRSFRDRRERVTIISKVGYIPGGDGAQRLYEKESQRHDPKYIRQACEMSLWRLETDTIDVYLLHDPPLEAIRKSATWNALRKLKKEGKIRYFGASVNPEGAVECINQGAEVIMTPFNLLTQEAARGVFPLAKKRGVGILARSPFAGGRIFKRGKESPINPYRFLARKGRTLAEAAVKFTLAQEGVSCVVAGIMQPAEITKNIKACKRPLISKVDLARVARVDS